MPLFLVLIISSMIIETECKVFNNTSVKLDLEVGKMMNYLLILFKIDGGALGICSDKKWMMTLK